MKILICGSRHFKDRNLMSERMFFFGKDVTVIHGDAAGADKMAGDIAAFLGLSIEVFPANWTKHGKAAGPIRNQQMLDEGKPDHVIAFPLPGSIGTWDMINRAKRAGVSVEIIEQPSSPHLTNQEGSNRA